jgi:hypothetical protein
LAWRFESARGLHRRQAHRLEVDEEAQGAVLAGRAGAVRAPLLLDDDRDLAPKAPEITASTFAP